MKKPKKIRARRHRHLTKTDIVRITDQCALRFADERPWMRVRNWEHLIGERPHPNGSFMYRRSLAITARSTGAGREGK